MYTSETKMTSITKDNFKKMFNCYGLNDVNIFSLKRKHVEAERKH